MAETESSTFLVTGLEYLFENVKEEHQKVIDVIDLSFGGHGVTEIEIEENISDDMVIKIANK